MNLQQWFQYRQGTAILVPGGGAGNEGQCFQAMDDCLHYVYNKPYLYMGYDGGAIDVYTRAALDQFGFTRIPAGQPIRAGDFVFFDRLAPKPSGGYYGHVDIASRDGSVSDFYAYDTNWQNNKTLQEYRHTGQQSYVAGYYRLPGGKGADQPINQENTTMQGEEPKELWRALLHREPENDQVWRGWVGHQFGEAADTFRRSGEWLGQNHILLRGYPELVIQFQQQTATLQALRETEALDKQQKADVEAQLNAANAALAEAHKNLQAMQANAAAVAENTGVLRKIAQALHIPGF